MKSACITEESISIVDFFRKFPIEISEYQRPYVWKGREVLKLCNDLLEYFETNPNAKTAIPDFYLGTIILVKKENKSFYEIIDGQQRITTLLIMGIILDNDFGDLNVFSSISEANIKTNAAYLKYLLKNKKHIDFSRINITYLITNSDDLAFKFYTSLNTSGKKLDGIDIIKPFHLQALNKTRQEELAKKIEKYQLGNENWLGFISELLLKSRFWQGLDFQEFPRKNSPEWKIVLPNHFANYEDRSSKEDVKYYEGSIVNDNEKKIKASYKVRQPLNVGENFINYILYYCEIFDKINKKLNENIFKKLEFLEGIDFNKEYFEMALITFVSKFGEQVIDDDDFEENCFLLFKVCFYSRLKKTVAKKTISKNEELIKFLDRITYCYSKAELFNYCRNYNDSEIIENFEPKGRRGMFEETFRSLMNVKNKL